MNKQEFLAELKGRLHALDEVEIKKTLAYYAEIIDDRVEEGMTEEQAIEGMESIGAIAEQALQDAPLSQLIRAKKPRNLSAGTIALLVLGSPVWLPLLIAALAIVLSVFVVIWSLVVSLWAVVVSFAAGGLASIVAVPFVGGMASTLVYLGTGLALIGTALLLYQPSIQAVRLTCRAMAETARRIKSILIRREAA
jgi:uncharacterized membrane protein